MMTSNPVSIPQVSWDDVDKLMGYSAAFGTASLQLLALSIAILAGLAALRQINIVYSMKTTQRTAACWKFIVATVVVWILAYSVSAIRIVSPEASRMICMVAIGLEAGFTAIYVAYLYLVVRDISQLLR